MKTDGKDCHCTIPAGWRRPAAALLPFCAAGGPAFSNPVLNCEHAKEMTPTKLEYNIGSTIYGQPLRLVRSQSTGGQMEWILCRDEADQRDDRVFIAGLTNEHLAKLGEAAKARLI